MDTAADGPTRIQTWVVWIPIDQDKSELFLRESRNPEKKFTLIRNNQSG